jgi:hypothetical protein
MTNFTHLRRGRQGVSSQAERVIQFLERLGALHGPSFPQVAAEKLLSYMGTSSLAGCHPTVSLHRVRGVHGTDQPGQLEVELLGRLPRGPRPGECVSVHLARLEQYRGFQVKTLPLAPGGAEGDLFGEEGDLLTIHGARTYTVHHSPYTLRFFEEIPVGEVREVAEGLPFALVAMAETANLSPRFVFHHERVDGRLALFHGDGLALKTAMNLRSNPLETRVLLDLAEPGGWLLRGAVEPIRERDHPVAWEKVHAGFASGGWGRPSRVYRFLADLGEAEPIGFAGAT